MDKVKFDIISQGVVEIEGRGDDTESGLLTATDRSDRTDALRIDIPDRGFSSPRSNLN